MRQWRGAGENEGRPESRSRRSTSVRGVFLGAGSRTGGDGMGRNRPDVSFGAGKGSTDLFCIIRNGELPNVFSAKRGGAWGRTEGV